MLKKIFYFLIGIVFFYSCNQDIETKADIASIALEEYLLTSTEYYPLDNIPYLETIKKQSINTKCDINIDSLKAKFYVSSNYNSKSISKYKMKSIYLDALISCYSTDELSVNLIKLDKVSDWTNDMLKKYYNLELDTPVSYEVNINEINGLPFAIKNTKSVKQLKNVYQDINSNSCIKYLKISPVYRIDKYLYVEIVNGCTERGENRTLYIFRQYKNKFIIDNKIKTEYKY